MSATDSVLFTGAGGAVTTGQLTGALEQVGIVEGDTLYVHSDLVRFGRIPPQMLQDREVFFRAIEDAILNVIGPSGTLLMPTFTTSALKTHRWSMTESPSETGVLTEHFRRRPGVSRTPHATHSAAVFGARASLFGDPSIAPFGTGSTFDVLTRTGGKIVLLGADFHWCTYIHHIESVAGVRYRKRMAVHITMDDGRGQSVMNAIRFTRPSRYWPDFGRFKRRLMAAGSYRTTTLGPAEVASIECSSMLREGLDALKEDALFFYNVRSRRAQLAFDVKGLIGRVLRPLRR